MAAIFVVFGPLLATAQAQGPSFVYPVDGATNVDTSQPVRWTSVPNAQAYTLWVGSTCGGSDLVNTGEIQTTSYLTSNLPAGGPVSCFGFWIS